ncbi:MAG: glycosyltransferase family A protein, partial [Casimicrobiaceae bacterium]
VARYAGRLEITHIRRAPRGLSRSRNAGLAVARGKTVALADDDCRYRPDTIARVAAFFVSEPGADEMTGRAVAAPGQRAPARFARNAHWLSRRSVFVGGMSCVIFLRAQRNGEIILSQARHPRESGDPATFRARHWVPAFAGMTKWRCAGMTKWRCAGMTVGAISQG